MTEYFIVANSFAAPFFSDQSTAYAKGETPEAALTDFVAKYSHPAGLYSAACYASADAYHKNQKPLATWLCNSELKNQKVTKGKHCFSSLGIEPGVFEVDGVTYTVQDPKGGQIVKGTPNDR